MPELGTVGWDVASTVIPTLHLLWRELITGDEFIEVAYVLLYLPWDNLCGTSEDKPTEKSEPHIHIH